MSREQPERKPFQRREDYKPMMIQVSGLKISLDEFKEKVPNRVSVAQNGDDFCMFTSSKFWQEKAKELFPEATIELVDSIQKVYQDSLKIQAALNWNKFKRLNQDYVADKEKEIFAVFRSTAFESKEPATAEEYAKTMARIAFKESSKHQLIYVIRPWLIPVFKELRENHVLRDREDKQVEHFVHYINRSPMIRPSDKAIICKAYIKISDVQSVVEGLGQMERFPQVIFLNPTTMDEKRKTTRNMRQQRDERVQKRQQERGGKFDEQRPRRQPREPREPGQQKEYREPREPREPRERREPREQREPRAPREYREPREPREQRQPREHREEGRPERQDRQDRRQPREFEDTRRDRKDERPDRRPRNDKPQETANQPVISFDEPKSAKPAIDTFALQHVPETMEEQQLQKSLSSALNQEVRVKKSGSDFVCTVVTAHSEKLQSILDRLKINGVQITYTKK